MEPLMTSDEVAAYLRVDVVTIRRLVNRGELPAYRVGGEYRFMKRELEAYLRRQRVPDTLAQRMRKFFTSGKLPTDASPGSGAFGRFTDRARDVLNLAQEEAQRLHHHYIGTEHLLLGLVREDEGIAAQALKGLGVGLDTVRGRVEALVGRGDQEVTGEMPLTRRAKKVLELAIDEARRLGHHYLSTEHLLLGMIREGEGVGARVLHELGVDLGNARAQTMKLREAEPEEPEPAPPEGAAALVAAGEEALTCEGCGARCPVYFRYCFHCGRPLAAH